MQLTIANVERDVAPGSRDLGVERGTTDAGRTLEEIEAVGWQLLHVGYVYVPTGESSRDKFLASGQYTAISGETVGVYLFRTTD